MPNNYQNVLQGLAREAKWMGMDPYDASIHQLGEMS